MRAGPSLKIVIVSNGFGEDLIGSRIAKALVEIDPSTQIFPVPLIGDGSAYRRINITPIVQSPIPKSGGFLRTFTDVIRDIGGGTIGAVFKSRRAIKVQLKCADLVIAVGDVFCLLWATPLRIPAVFLPTAKSDHFMPHSAVEYSIIRRRANQIYTRDQLTADAFIRNRIRAHFLGNPMMDHLFDSPPLDAPLGMAKIAILPGSRTESAANLTRIIEALLETTSDRPIFGWICRAPQVDPSAINSCLYRFKFEEQNEHWTRPLSSITLCVTSEFSAAVQASDCVIGLAGTANEQAAWMGKPVVAFPGTGPQSQRIRFLEQRQLIGPLLRFVDSTNPKDIATTVIQTLSLPHAPAPRPQHAARLIASKILDEYSK